MTRSPDRPNLESQSVAFETVKGIGMGALIGAAFTVVSRGYGVWVNAAQCGAFLGLINMFESMAVNRERARARPYVKRLEAELAVKDAALGLTPER